MAEQPDWQPISRLPLIGSMEQLARWKRDNLSVDQRDEVDRLTEQVRRCRTVIDLILSLAEQLKRGTIEKVLAQSDLELGLEFLLSKGKPRH
jgi:hypothetical protein